MLAQKMIALKWFKCKSGVKSYIAKVNIVWELQHFLIFLLHLTFINVKNIGRGFLLRYKIVFNPDIDFYSHLCFSRSNVLPPWNESSLIPWAKITIWFGIVPLIWPTPLPPYSPKNLFFTDINDGEEGGGTFQVVPNCLAGFVPVQHR